MDDLRAGRRFYSLQGGRDLGCRFFGVLAGTIGKLAECGGLHAKRFGFHRPLAPKFPYSVYYGVEGNVVRVYAVVDNRRNPAWVESRVAGARNRERRGENNTGERSGSARDAGAEGEG